MTNQFRDIIAAIKVESPTLIRNGDAFNNEIAARLRAESYLDKNVPLKMTLCNQHVERGVSMNSYYMAKFARTGSLGQYETLNPLFDFIVRGKKKNNDHA